MGEGVLQFNVVSMVEDVLQQHGKKLGDPDFASKRAQEACMLILPPFPIKDQFVFFIVKKP